jgi:formyl-CoA transferase
MDAEVESPRLGTIRQVGSPITISGAAAAPARISPLPPPALGEHSAEILRELGYDQAAIERLGRLGVT